MQSVITVENLTFAYSNTPVLKDVNLHIRDKEFVWIVGPNGGGKTTLLKLMLGLLQPDAGSIRIFDRPPEKGRKFIGYMSQSVSLDRQFPATVTDVVGMGRLGSGARFVRFSRGDREATLKALKDVGMEKYAGESFSSLSGGQQRRALIARALASQPRILLLDEPTANLDLAAEKELYELLNQLNRQLTIVLVSHDPAFVSDFVKRVVCVNREVHEHPTAAVEGSYIGEFYGGARRLVRHDRQIEAEKDGD
jgi:zinc transport system ATP-binding protein